MYFIGSEACCRANGLIIGILDVGKVCVPVVLVFVADHGLHLCHGVVYTFDTAVSGRVVGARSEFVYTQKFVDSYCKLCAELESVV